MNKLNETNEIRINKYLSMSGYCSRRAADDIVSQGRVTVDGVVATMGTKVSQNAVVKVDNKIVGFSCYGVNSDGDGEVIAIYLLAEYQKRKLGYELMNVTFDKMADKTKVTLWVLKGNEKAIKFYERYGFRFDGMEKQSSVGTELRMVFRR